jgi:hypothetical protein
MIVVLSAALEVTSRPAAMKPTSTGSGVGPTGRGRPSRRPVRASQCTMAVPRRGGSLRIASAASTRESGEKAMVPSTTGKFSFEALGGSATRPLLKARCVRASRMSTESIPATATRVPSGLNLTAEIALDTAAV